MGNTNSFFSAPDLDDDEVIPIKKKDLAVTHEEGHIVTENVQIDGFLAGNLDGSPMSVRSHTKIVTGKETEGSNDSVSGEISEETKKKLSGMLIENSTMPPVRNAIIDNPKERVIIRFTAPVKNIYCDIDVPLDMTANDLVVGLNEAYHLEIDISDIRQCYLSCENPIALIKGKRLLGEFGVRDGSLITFHR